MLAALGGLLRPRQLSGENWSEWTILYGSLAFIEVYRLADAEFMAADCLACLFGVAARNVWVRVERGIGPVRDPASRSLRT